jgi:hypothetical protein
MPDTHRHVANINAITLADDLTEFDILLPEAPLHLNRYNFLLNYAVHHTRRDYLNAMYGFFYAEIQTSQLWTFPYP